MNQLKVLNRDEIKYIAMLTMLLNHISHMFLEQGTMLAYVFESVGYFTAPVMCYFLVEGYAHTRSKKNYGIRLAVFALVSQVPFALALDPARLSMISTLFICFMILVVKEKVQEPVLQKALYVFLVAITYFMDWQIFAPMMVLMIAYDMDEPRQLVKDYLIIYLVMALMLFPDNDFTTGKEFLINYGYGLLRGIMVPAACLVLLVFYNGKRAKHGQKLSKWFFYLFYPGHLLVLYLIKVLV